MYILDRAFLHMYIRKNGKITYVNLLGNVYYSCR